MPFIVVGGVTIPVSPSGGKVNRLDDVDRQRAFDNTYRASATGNAKREWQFSTPPVTRTMFGIYKSALGVVDGQVCSGDVFEGSQNYVFQSENFGTTWVADGTPTRTPANVTVGGITLDLIGDDSAAAVEGYHQNIVFGANGIKAVSIHARQGTSTSSIVRLRDTSVAVDRLLAAITWPGGVPLVTMTTGVDLGSQLIGSGVYRFKFSTISLTAANTNELDVWPATTAALAVANTGNGDFGGVQAEDGAVVSPYAKTTTAGVLTTLVTCCTEVTDWTPVKSVNDFMYVLSFSVHEV